MSNNIMLRIGVLIDQLSLGGVTKIASEEVRYLKKLGYQVDLLVLLRTKRKKFINLIDSEIKIKFLSDKFPKIFKKYFKFPFFYYFSSFHITSPFIINRAIKKNDYDLIIAHGTYTCLSAIGLFKKVKVPFIAYIWDPVSYILRRVYSNTRLRFFFPILKPIAYFVDNIIVKNSIATVTGSEVHYKNLKSFDENKIFIVYPGCKEINNYNNNKEKFILSVTRWDFGKKPEFLLEVMKRLKNEYNLIVAGGWLRDKQKSKFEKAIITENLSNKVKVLGYVSNNKLERLFSKAKVLIYPNFEAFGLTGLEAASFGCPIIFPKGSGVTDLYEHGKQGFFPEEGNVDEFVKYLNIILYDDDLALEMGKSAFKIAKNYTFYEHAKNLSKIIKKSFEREQ
ncbi:MAG: glycosyltransferase family 4 protein [Candidatus Humimicrobiia bacterium]